ncbi:MAG: response regulator transcription factor [Rhodoferax sp.]|uniref:response regulator n=1 Tax=Rhodoferax sp. TaxID=50421 RepID=UPI0017EEEE19|nr:response regulator transcription factor [Rhodoferax sp.]NMM15036.1 response regulator transcription factor [Rhodoferax sp.]NMM21487.1 response regulator transcription factor [Rhodoferax sp.]
MTRLYLVDDHQLMREGLRALLEARGHTVVGESADPTEALADLLRLRPEVLLLDLHLGERSGFELLAELQRRRLPTRCVVLTMSAQPRHVAEALRMGASGYVLKGSAGSDLMSAVEAAVQGKKHLGADVADLALQVFTQQNDEDPLGALSPRERQIITMVVNGQSSAKIGLELHLSPKTVATYRSRLMAKLGVSDVTGLVRLAVHYKLIDFENQDVRGRRSSDLAH